MGQGFSRVAMLRTPQHLTLKIFFLNSWNHAILVIIWYMHPKCIGFDPYLLGGWGWKSNLPSFLVMCRRGWLPCDCCHHRPWLPTILCKEWMPVAFNAIYAIWVGGFLSYFLHNWDSFFNSTDITLQSSVSAVRWSESPVCIHINTNINWSWSSNTLATWCEKLTLWKRPWCWERLKAEGEGDDRGWDGWMASPTRWAWVWHEFEHALGVIDGQGGLACSRPWGHKESDTTELLNYLCQTELSETINWFALTKSVCHTGFGFPGSNVEYPGVIPGSGRSPGGGNGNPLQYSCLENPMGRGTWRVTVDGIAKSRIWLKRLNTQGKYLETLHPIYSNLCF